MKKYFWLRATFLLLFVFMTGISISYAETITTTAQGGLWDSESTWVGGKLPQVTDDVVITSVVTTGSVSYTSRTFKMANLTVNVGGKILRESDKSGRYSLEIHGNLINNGEIIDHLDYFDIYLYGNLENNGVFKPRLVYMQGANQHISTTKPIECKTFNLDMTDNDLIASSNLQFKNCYIPTKGTKTLNMGFFNLSLSADSVTYDGYYGEIYSKSKLLVPVTFDGTGTLELDKSIIGKTITGNCILKSPSYAFISDLTVEGNLTMDENTKVSSTENLIKLIVKGSFTNLSELNKDSVLCGNVKAPKRSMKLYVYGDCNNVGESGTSTTFYPITNGDTISLKGNFDGDVEIRQAENSATPGGKVKIDGEVSILGDLHIYSILEIIEGASLNMLTKEIINPIYVGSGTGSISNNGDIFQYHRVNNSWSYRSFSNKPGMSIDYELRDWTDRLEGVEVSVYNGQTYPNLPGSTKRWWRLKPLGDGQVKYFTLKLYYNESQLNGQKEENLKVFQSTDEGENWEVISLGEYAKLDTVENSITIGVWNKDESMLSEFGDFVISSGDGTVPIPSPIIVDLVGSPNIRLGAPNRFTVHLYNVSNTVAEPFMAAIAISNNIIFKQMEIPTNNGKIVLPIDSIGTPKDDMQFFYIPYLEPNEHYSFDVIVTGVQDGTKSISLEETYITAAVVINDMRDRFIKDGWNGLLNNYQLEELTAEEQAKLDERVKQTLKQIEIDKKKEGSGAVAQAECLKNMFEGMGFPASSVHWLGVNIGTSLELLDRTTEPYRQNIWNWLKKKTNTTENEGIALVAGKLINGNIVTSWDPNEKVGPAGYGDQNFISSIPRMNYTIMFENKKEATAPAYRVQIVDTLSAVFNPETVKFGATSHSGDQYNWKMERNGNILKWDIEGIELPPNATPPEGEGFVSFSVDLAEGLQSGVPIENRATIIFDMNEPITTNTWSNILDEIAPVTVMNPINYSAGDTLINVSCSAIDNENGSGIGKYQFYASIDYSPFKFIGESFENTIQYRISDSTKHNYRFYVLTSDNVNNSEKSVPAIGVLNTFLVNTRVYNGIDNKISVYPNPTTDFINVDFFIENQSKVELKIYSIAGQLIKSTGTNLYNSGQHRITEDVSHLAEGVYLAKIVVDKRSVVYKITKK